MDWHKGTEKLWNTQANNWASRSEKMWDVGSRKSIIPFFMNFLKEGYVADLGCGDGYGAYTLAKNGFQVTGVDLSNEMIEIANHRVIENLTFIQGDLKKLPFENETLDGAIAINSLEWVEQPLIVLNEVNRALKTDGYLCVGLLGATAGPRENSYRRLYGESVFCNTMMPWEFSRLATENGFKIVGEEGVYKQGVQDIHLQRLDNELKQALSFMWLFMLQKK